MLDKAGIVDYRKDMQVHDSKRYLYVCVYMHLFNIANEKRD
jgi:hypothetical protein